uniref:Ovule protein n=1 Tax=Heterorhabditis bacteriophora TaxID=37862 RepID=A0A1I7WP11_HETBA
MYKYFNVIIMNFIFAYYTLNSFFGIYILITSLSHMSYGVLHSSRPTCQSLQMFWKSPLRTSQLSCGLSNLS